MIDAKGREITLDRMLARRHKCWETYHSIDKDQECVRVNVETILKDVELTRQVVEKPYLLIELAMLIVDKRSNTCPFFLNDVQRDFIHKYENSDGRPFFILKGRQQGFTSLITAIQLSYTIVRKNFSGFSVADCNDNVNTIFNDKARVVYDRLPQALKPQEKYNNRREFFFDALNSSWRVSMASNEMGRSKTINFCHFSEVAFYECELSMLQKSIGEAFTPDAVVVYETTANGYNQAKDLWDSGSCQNLFYEWWRTSEYTSNDISLLDYPSDKWIKERIEWLKSNGVSVTSIAWYVQKYNSYLDKDSIKQEYPCFPQEAFISSGNCEFGNELVVNQLSKVIGIEPSRVGYFEYDKRHSTESFDGIVIDNIYWVDDKNGSITIHEEPYVDSVRGAKPYAIGGDTAGEGSDYFTAKVIDNINGRTVATFRRQQIDDDLYAEQLYCLGKMYHNAIIGVEINFSREAMKHLSNLGYENLYVTEHIDSITERPTQDLGFRTTSISRPIIIAELKRRFRDSEGSIEVDIPTLNEMLTFVKDEKGKPQAMVGKHDDLVMALAIAHFIGQQGNHEWTTPEKEKSQIEMMFPNAFKDRVQDSTYGEYIQW